MYIAGDDDQAIFKWAGADVNNFLELKGQLTVLDQSYRVPRHAHFLASSLIKRVSKRREKFWKPLPQEGKLLWHSSLEHVDMSEGEWLILARKTIFNCLFTTRRKINKRPSYTYFHYSRGKGKRG
jgi:hypothetical protein